jgi:predicted short-subunit dehydrogenase-like oxidoreductase (DUF2520 family)
MIPSRKPARALNIAIVGAGSVGTTLGMILSENHQRITAVVSRSMTSAKRCGRLVSCRKVSTSLDAIPQKTEIVLIATPHGAVGEVASALARRKDFRWRGVGVCHASGMLTAAALEPLLEVGATVFSFHPLQTFPRDFHPRKIVPSARGIVFGIDGPPAGIRVAKKLAHALEGKVLLVPPELREFYHAACVAASAHVATLLGILKAFYGDIAPGRQDFMDAFLPIIHATLDNVRASSPARALTGPVARGGTETVNRHFEAIKRTAPALLPYYARMTLETIRVAMEKRSLTGEQVKELTSLALSHLNDSLESEESM